VFENLDLAAKGKAILLDGDIIESTQSTGLYQIGGMIKNAVFNMLPYPTSLNRLNALILKKRNINIFSSPDN
jgi:hypothetical protein